MLMRIVALVLALADLAEGASNRPKAICALICWILRPIEKLLAEHLCTLPDAPLPIMRCADVRVDAMCLAMRFRALAQEFASEAEFAISLGDEDGLWGELLSCFERARGFSLNDCPPLALANTSTPLACIPDTS